MEEEIELTRDGKTYKGVYKIVKGQIIVMPRFDTDAASKETQLGGSKDAPKALATIMLGEIVSEHIRLEKNRGK